MEDLTQSSQFLASLQLQLSSQHKFLTLGLLPQQWQRGAVWLHSNIQNIWWTIFYQHFYSTFDSLRISSWTLPPKMEEATYATKIFQFKQLCVRCFKYINWFSINGNTRWTFSEHSWSSLDKSFGYLVKSFPLHLCKVVSKTRVSSCNDYTKISSYSYTKLNRWKGCGEATARKSPFYQTFLN